MPPVRQAKSASALRWGVLLAIAGYIRKPIFTPDASGLTEAWVCRSASPRPASCTARRAKAGGADDGSSVAQVEAPRGSGVAKGAEKATTVSTKVQDAPPKVVEQRSPAEERGSPGGGNGVSNQANPAEELSAAVVAGMSSAAASVGNSLQNAAVSWAQGVMDSINDSAKRSAEEAKQLPGRMVNGAVSFAADRAGELRDGATSYAQAQVDAAVESVKAAPKVVADRTVESLDGARQAAADRVKQSINDGVDSIKAIPKVAADSLAQSVNKGADNLKKSINSGVDSFGQKISAEVSASVEQAKAAPKIAVDGFVEGITTAAQQSAAQVGNSAKSVLTSRVEEAVQATRAAPARIQTDLELASEQVLRRSQDAIINSPKRSITSMSSALQEQVASASQKAQNQVTERVQGFGPWVQSGVTTRIDEVKKDTQRLIDEVQETIREAPKQLQSSFQKRLAEVKMPKLLPEPSDKK